MESYGKILKDAREGKKISIEEAALNSQIGINYIKAIEEENEGAFSSDAYLTGFMRNYADYLNVDSAHLLRLFHNKKIQEAPIPRELTAPVRNRKPLIFTLISLFFLILCVAAWWFYFSPSAKKNLFRGYGKEEKLKTASKEYNIDSSAFTGRLYSGDKITFTSKNKLVSATVVNTLGELSISSPVGVINTELAEENEYDLDGDGTADIILYVSDISATQKEAGAEVRAMRVVGGEIFSTADIPFSDEVGDEKKMTILFTENRAYPFTLKGNFRASCLFRHKIDNKNIYENYLASGSVVDMNPKNGVRIWVSNAAAVKFNVIAEKGNFTLDIGKQGRIEVKDIKWVKDRNGTFKLAVIDVD